MQRSLMHIYLKRRGGEGSPTDDWLTQTERALTRRKSWRHNSVPASISLRPAPLCCSVNGRWDGRACGALFSEDRYALMHRRLRVLLKMSECAPTYIQSCLWKPCGGEARCPQHKHTYRWAVRRRRRDKRCAPAGLLDWQTSYFNP